MGRGYINYDLSIIFPPRIKRIIIMKIAFTTCTNSWVPFARVVGKTLLEHNPDYQYYICITDKKEADMASFYEGYDIVPCDEIGNGRDWTICTAVWYQYQKCPEAILPRILF